MKEIDNLMFKKRDSDPEFKVIFTRNRDGDVLVRFDSLTTTMPSTIVKPDSLAQIGEELVEYIKETSEWV